MSFQEENLKAALVCAQNYLALLKDFASVNLFFFDDLLCKVKAVGGQSPLPQKVFGSQLEQKCQCNEPGLL